MSPISRRINSAHSTILRLVQRHNDTGSVNDRPRNWRQMVTTEAVELTSCVQRLSARSQPPGADWRTSGKVECYSTTPNTVALSGCGWLLNFYQPCLRRYIAEHKMNNSNNDLLMCTKMYHNCPIKLRINKHYTQMNYLTFTGGAFSLRVSILHKLSISEV